MAPICLLLLKQEACMKREKAVSLCFLKAGFANSTAAAATPSDFPMLLHYS